MALPSAKLFLAHAVLGFAKPMPRDPSEVEKLTEQLRPAFPNLLARPLLPPEAPPQTPHLTLASTSAQVAVSALQADFQVPFYGDYLEDTSRSIEYIEAKVLAILGGLEALEVPVMTVGLIGTIRFSFGVDGPSAVDHILGTHLKLDVDASAVQDALARVAVRVRDTYYVTMTLSNYESRLLERPFLPNMQAVTVRRWEGKINDRGLDLNLDINNGLEGMTLGRDPEVTEEGVRAVTRMFKEVAEHAAPTFVENGRVDVDSLVASSNG
jgi:hypothetical protein